MIKLEFLELDRLEYYLLGFDQGGRTQGTTTATKEGPLPKTVFPIAFNNALAVLPVVINNSSNPNATVVDVWPQIRDLKADSFIMFMQGIGDLNRYDGVYWVALGD